MRPPQAGGAEGRFTLEQVAKAVAPETVPAISSGTYLGKYEIVHRIALGGMAEIYLARVTGLEGFEKFVVLKRILPQLAAQEEFVRMFFREARVAAALDHANIAHVYDIGQDGGVLFFTMEYLHGEDMRWIVKRLAKSDARLPLEHALAVVNGVASALHFAHEKKGADGGPLGIVHRDVSPSNIVVTYDGGVKIVDFGVAKITADPDLSRRYSLKGKLAYMAPEQLHGEVDRRSDVFALGVVLYELTTHARLFKAATEVETIRMVLEGQVILPTERAAAYPPALERIVMRAVERDPGRRYATARELQIDLEAFARDHKLQMSSAALAEWMERSFGPKRELWHTLALPPALSRTMAAQSPAARPTTEAETRVAGPQPAKPRARRRAPLVVAAAALALLAAAGAGLALRKSAPPATRPVEPVMLVAEKGTVAVEHVTPPAPHPAPAAPSPSPAPPPPRTLATTLPPRHVPPRAARRRADSFSAAFARREPEIRRCFADAGGTAPGGEISLRFQAGRDGHVTAVSVLPPATAATPLGSCLVKVGARTVFAPQAAPVTFRIPLTVQAPRGQRP